MPLFDDVGVMLTVLALIWAGAGCARAVRREAAGGYAPWCVRLAVVGVWLVDVTVIALVVLWSLHQP